MRHVEEMSELEASQAHEVVQAVLACERAVRKTTQCDKINHREPWQSGTRQHLHWHHPRFRDDPHFPESVWGERQRVVLTR